VGESGSGGERTRVWVETMERGRLTDPLDGITLFAPNPIEILRCMRLVRGIITLNSVLKF